MSIAARRLRRATNKRFHVIGSAIIDPNGNPFIPIGANIAYYRYMMPNFTYDPAYSAVGKSDAALEWGWNTIRIPTRFDDDFALLNKLITEYTAKKIVCIIDCHELWRDKADGSLGVNSTRIGQLDIFWKTIATTYRHNPYVWFNLHNEPPLNGTAWADIHVRHAQLVRSCGATNIIVCDAPGGALDPGVDVAGGVYSWDPSMLPAVITAARGNVALSFHNYGYRWCDEMMNWYIDHATAIAPLMIGEFGYNVIESKASSAGSWDTNYLGACASINAYHKRGVGVTMWIGSGGIDELGLKRNSDSFWTGGPSANLAGVGKRLWDAAHHVNTTRPLTVNWIANPRAIDTSSTGYGTGWKLNTGSITFLTNQSWASSGTSTAVASPTTAYITYYRSYQLEYMQSGTHSGSCELYAPNNGTFQVVVQWKDSKEQNISNNTTTHTVVSGANTVSFPIIKPQNGAGLWIAIQPIGYPAGQTFAVTNLTTNGEKFFNGSTTDTTSAYYCWSSITDLSASVQSNKYQ